MPVTLTAAMLDRRWPHAPHSLVDGIVASAPTVLAKYEIAEPLELAHLLAQVSVECAAGTQLEENLHYSAERLRAVWPKRFPTLAQAQACAHNPRLTADHVYDGRMGNRPGSDDGWNCRGRGLIDITGREMYELVGKLTGLDLVGHPELACDPRFALEVACGFWQQCGAKPHALKDDIVRVTECVNGGTNGLADRRAWRRTWGHELGV
jgi:putative chitinase